MGNADIVKRSPKIGWLSGSADPTAAGRRFRMTAPIGMLTARGHDVGEFRPDEEALYDTLVFAKAYGAEHLALARRAKDRGAVVVFDLCDNHFFNPDGLPKYEKAAASIRQMADLADHVTCTTQTLAAVIADQVVADRSPVVVEDVAEIGAPVAAAYDGGRLSLLWFGSHGSPNAPSGLGDIGLIREPLERLAARADVELVVCSNSHEKYRDVVAPLAVPSRYVEWSEQAQRDALAACHAVVLPVSRNPFTDSKSHNRLTTALGAGVPVLASALPAYQVLGAFCTLDDWDAGFERLLTGYGAERARAHAARPFIQARWSPTVLAPAWEAVLGLLEDAPSRDRASGVHGALDFVSEPGVIEGWARDARSPRPVEVRLLSQAGTELSRARADRPRPDLHQAGMAGSDCGFRFEPAATGEVGVMVVEASTGVTIGRVEPVAPASGGATPLLVDTVMSGEGADAQARLLAAVMSADGELNALRSTLARLVVSLGDAPHLARRVQASLLDTDEKAPAAPH